MMRKFYCLFVLALIQTSTNGDLLKVDIRRGDVRAGNLFSLGPGLPREAKAYARKVRELEAALQDMAIKEQDLREKVRVLRGRHLDTLKLLEEREAQTEAEFALVGERAAHQLEEEIEKVRVEMRAQADQELAELRAALTQQFRAEKEDLVKRLLEDHRQKLEEMRQQATFEVAEASERAREEVLGSARERLRIEMAEHMKANRADLEAELLSRRKRERAKLQLLRLLFANYLNQKEKQWMERIEEARDFARKEQVRAYQLEKIIQESSQPVSAKKALATSAKPGMMPGAAPEIQSYKST